MNTPSDSPEFHSLINQILVGNSGKQDLLISALAVASKFPEYGLKGIIQEFTSYANRRAAQGWFTDSQVLYEFTLFLTESVTDDHNELAGALHYSLGRLLSGRNSLQPAIAHLKESLELLPDDHRSRQIAQKLLHEAEKRLGLVPEQLRGPIIAGQPKHKRINRSLTTTASNSVSHRFQFKQSGFGHPQSTPSWQIPPGRLPPGSLSRSEKIDDARISSKSEKLDTRTWSDHLQELGHQISFIGNWLDKYISYSAQKDGQDTSHFPEIARDLADRAVGGNLKNLSYTSDRIKASRKAIEQAFGTLGLAWFDYELARRMCAKGKRSNEALQYLSTAVQILKEQPHDLRAQVEQLHQCLTRACSDVDRDRGHESERFDNHDAIATSPDPTSTSNISNSPDDSSFVTIPSIFTEATSPISDVNIPILAETSENAYEISPSEIIPADTNLGDSHACPGPHEQAIELQQQMPDLQIMPGHGQTALTAAHADFEQPMQANKDPEEPTTQLLHGLACPLATLEIAASVNHVAEAGEIGPDQQLPALADAHKELEVLIAQLKTSLDSANAQLAIVDSTGERLRNQLQDAEEELMRIKEELAETQLSLKHTQAQLDCANEDNIELSRTITRKENEVALLQQRPLESNTALETACTQLAGREANYAEQCGRLQELFPGSQYQDDLGQQASQLQLVTEQLSLALARIENLERKPEESGATISRGDDKPNGGFWTRFWLWFIGRGS